MVNGTPALVLQKPDGSLLTRIEAEQELWDKCKTSHMMRRLAWGQLGLENRYAWMLKPTSVTHWILDELIRKRQISGDPIGVQPELESDDSYFNSFTQRLKVFVEDGRALRPKEGEGIDMSDMQQPPGGQPPMNYAPPPPPMGGFPGQAPPQQYGAPPQAIQQPMGGFPGAPPAPQFGAPQHMPQFGAPPSPQAPSFPPQGAPPPIGQPQMAPPQGAPPMQQPPQMGGAPPTPPAQAPSNRRGRGKADAGAAPPVPPNQMAMPGMGAPQQQMTQFGQQAPQQSAQGSDTGALQQQIAKLESVVAQQGKVLAEVYRLLRGVDAATSILVRPYYAREGQPQLPQHPNQLGVEATFKEIGLPYPS